MKEERTKERKKERKNEGTNERKKERQKKRMKVSGLLTCLCQRISRGTCARSLFLFLLRAFAPHTLALCVQCSNVPTSQRSDIPTCSGCEDGRSNTNATRTVSHCSCHRHFWDWTTHRRNGAAGGTS